LEGESFPVSKSVAKEVPMGLLKDQIEFLFLGGNWEFLPPQLNKAQPSLPKNP